VISGLPNARRCPKTAPHHRTKYLYQFGINTKFLIVIVYDGSLIGYEYNNTSLEVLQIVQLYFVIFILSSILKDSKDCTDFEFGLYSESPSIPGYRRSLKGTNPK
jgi:hypothetical protein